MGSANYEIITFPLLNGDKVFDIYERNTELRVKTFNSYNKAKEIVKNLNSGGGFNGWTPTFFTK